MTDETTLRPRTAKAEALISDASISPTGKRAAFGARGDVLVAAGGERRGHQPHAIVRRRRALPALVARRQDCRLLERPQRRVRADAARRQTAPGRNRKSRRSGRASATRRIWSPDSKKLAFIDQAMKIRIYDVAREPGRSTSIRVPTGSATAASSRSASSGRRIHAGSATRDRPRRRATTRSFSTTRKPESCSRRRQRIPERHAAGVRSRGKYLFYASDRSFEPVYGNFDNSWTYPNPTQIVAVALRKDVKSPLAARNDAEGTAVRGEATMRQEKRRKKDGAARNTSSAAKRRHRSRRLRSARRRAADEARQLRRPPGDQGQAALPAAAAHRLRDEKSPIVYFDFQEREEKTVLDEADAFEATFDGKKLFVTQKKKFAMVEIKPAQKFEKPMATADIEVPVDPRAEWRQIFTDAYRFERDFFYDPNMHGVDWSGAARALRQAPRRFGHAMGRELRARRVHRRAQRVAHLSRGRRRRAGAEAIGRDARRRLGARQRRVPDQARHRRRAVGYRRAIAARRAWRQRQGRRLRARRQRRAA